MSDLSITATGAGLGAAAGLALGMSSRLAGGVSPAGATGLGIAAGALIGAGAAWTIERARERHDAPLLDPHVVLPALGAAAIVGGAKYGHSRYVASVAHSAISAAGPALLAGAAAAGLGALYLFDKGGK